MICPLCYYPVLSSGLCSVAQHSYRADCLREMVHCDSLYSERGVYLHFYLARRSLWTHGYMLATVRKQQVRAAIQYTFATCALVEHVLNLKKSYCVCMQPIARYRGFQQCFVKFRAKTVQHRKPELSKELGLRVTDTLSRYPTASTRAPGFKTLQGPALSCDEYIVNGRLQRCYLTRTHVGRHITAPSVAIRPFALACSFSQSQTRIHSSCTSPLLHSFSIIPLLAAAGCALYRLWTCSRSTAIARD